MSYGAVVHASIQEERESLEAREVRDGDALRRAVEWCCREFPEHSEGGVPHPCLLGAALTLRGAVPAPGFRDAVVRWFERGTGPGGFWEGAA